MLFHEIYGSYFGAVAAILTEAQNGKLTSARLREIAAEKAFGESIVTIPDKLQSGDWPLLRADLTTPIMHTPTMPLTNVQKMWMKAILLDPRIALFQPDMTGLEAVEPLFTPETFVYYDRYANGDPYGNEAYIACFRTILQAFREKRYLKICYRGHLGTRHSFLCIPYRLEYSAKDDKFRLITAINGKIMLINLSRIRSCQLMEEYPEEEYNPIDYREKSVVLEVKDERNALERVMLHFSDLEKETVQTGENRYRVTLYYKRDDETELLIRILSFGAVVKVISPEKFISLLKARLEKQVQLRGN